MAWLVYDRAAPASAAATASSAASETDHRAGASKSNSRSPGAARRSAQETDEDLDEESEPSATMRGTSSRSHGRLPQPGKRGSILDAGDPCEPLVEPIIPAAYERVTSANVTVAWPAEVKVSEPTSLGYTIAGLLEEAAIATGTEPREQLTVFLHGSRDDLHLATGTPEWATGVYDGAVHLVAEPSVDFGVRVATMRHEVMHAQLHAGVGCMPAWFNEGTAQYFSGRPPVDSWMTLLKQREPFDFDALSAPTIVEVPKEDASKLYAQSLAMVLFELDGSNGGLQEVVQSLHDIDASDPRRRARTLWKIRNPGVGPADVRASLAKRIFGVSSERDLDGLFDGRVCCTGDRRINELSCRSAPPGSEAAPTGARCRRY
jgi:hypothetical protein